MKINVNSNDQNTMQYINLI